MFVSVEISFDRETHQRNFWSIPRFLKLTCLKSVKLKRIRSSEFRLGLRFTGKPEFLSLKDSACLEPAILSRWVKPKKIVVARQRASTIDDCQTISTAFVFRPGPGKKRSVDCRPVMVGDGTIHSVRVPQCLGNVRQHTLAGVKIVWELFFGLSWSFKTEIRH